MPISSNPRIRASDPFDMDAPDYLNPQSDDAPLDPALRAKWLEERGFDPKADGDFVRANGAGMTVDGEFVGRISGDELDLIRDGIEHDECPDLPKIPAEFDMKPRWESFCRLYAFGHSAADAARHAGYAWGTARHAGWRLLQDPRILRRVRSLQQFAHENRPRSREDLLVRLETLYREAMNRGQYNAANQAIRTIARLEGYEVEKEPESGPESETKSAPKSAPKSVPEAADSA